MEGRGFLTIFIGVLAATLFFYGVSAGGVLAVNSIFSSKNNFGHQSYIGTFDVSNLKEEEAKGLLSAGFQSLEENFEVVLVYQDATTDLPIEAVTYDLDQTIELAGAGNENSIKCSVDEDALRTVLNQQFSTVYFSDDDVTDIANGIEKELETGVMPSKVYINDLMTGNGFSTDEVANANIPLTHTLEGLDDIAKALDGAEIAPFATFSLLEYIESENLGFMNNETLTVLASVLYSAVLQTNFTVDERYIGQVLNPDVPIGFEASINQSLGIDFVFTNLNKSSFTLNVTRDGQRLSASIMGLPFIHTYETVVGPISTFKPRIVEQYSAMLSKGSIKVQQAGTNGREASVLRTVFNGGIEVSHETVSTDYYAPIPRIEVLPLIQEDKPQPDANTDSGGKSKSGNDGGTNGNNDGYKNTEDGNDTSNVGNGGANTDSDKPGDKPGDKPKPDGKKEVEYDKGGKVIQ